MLHPVISARQHSTVKNLFFPSKNNFLRVSPFLEPIKYSIHTWLSTMNIIIFFSAPRIQDALLSLLQKALLLCISRTHPPAFFLQCLCQFYRLWKRQALSAFQLAELPR